MLFHFDLALFGSHFCYLFLNWDKITIVSRGVDLLSVVVEINNFSTVGLASGADSVGLRVRCAAYFSE